MSIKTNKLGIVAVAIFVGFVGDAILQIATHNGMGGPTGWGLNSYFKKHGRAECLFIAGGMMGLFYAIYVATGLPINIWTLSLYGIILDLIFRETHLFRSLDGYYKYFNYFWSAVWAIIPMLIPFLVYKLIHRK